ncbi:tail fiber domain-containing protein, partial [Pseudomonas juntendi]|uniref:tail fiber domain-containing protein n=1 Tax=Pseudomonas juntendi TaxID=2666183 RepID=UPI001581177E
SANDSLQAISDIKDNTDTAKGAALVGFDEETVQSALRKTKSLPDYAALRAYSGIATNLRITATGLAGQFTRLPDPVADNGCTIITDAAGRSWKREYVGPVNVLMAGAKGDGVAGETAAFSIAAKCAAASVINTISANNAKTCEVFVPAGTYRLESIVDTNYTDVVFLLDAGAKIINPANLNGKAVRAGVRITHQVQGGTGDGATAFSISSNTGTGEKSPLLNGFSTGQAAANYADSVSKIPFRDVAALYADSSSISELINSDNVTYTSNGVVVTGLPAEYYTKRLRRGMVIDTKHAQPWTGIIDSFVIDSANNQATFVLVDGWWQYGSSAAGVPVAGSGLYVNRTTKLFAMNSNTFLNSAIGTDMAAGYELGTYNNRQDASQLGDLSRHVWGYDSTSGGTYKGQAAFIARGKWLNGYVSRGADRHFVATDANWKTTFAVLGNGSIEAGSVATAGSWWLDIHTSGNDNDYDSRVLGSGGGAAAGGGNIGFYAANILAYGTLRPGVDNSTSCGTAAYRFTQFFAATATIGTSDESLKQDIAAIPDLVLDAWSQVDYQQYRFRESVAEKGKKARLHVGVIAQRVRKAFEERGLDPFSYGILCFDECNRSI